MHVLLRKARRNHPQKNKANIICLVFVCTVSGALGNNACKQNKVSAIASLMCKSYKLCHSPAFCVEPSNFSSAVSFISLQFFSLFYFFFLYAIKSFLFLFQLHSCSFFPFLIIHFYIFTSCTFFTSRTYFCLYSLFTFSSVLICVSHTLNFELSKCTSVFVIYTFFLVSYTFNCIYQILYFSFSIIFFISLHTVRPCPALFHTVFDVLHALVLYFNLVLIFLILAIGMLFVVCYYTSIFMIMMTFCLLP